LENIQGGLKDGREFIFGQGHMLFPEIVFYFYSTEIFLSKMEEIVI
jgi:hypothetical protein